jgi:hypothetical protein
MFSYKTIFLKKATNFDLKMGQKPFFEQELPCKCMNNSVSNQSMIVL